MPNEISPHTFHSRGAPHHDAHSGVPLERLPDWVPFRFSFDVSACKWGAKEGPRMNLTEEDLEKLRLKIWKEWVRLRCWQERLMFKRLVPSTRFPEAVLKWLNYRRLEADEVAKERGINPLDAWMEHAPKLDSQAGAKIKIQREPGVPLVLSHLQAEGNGASIILVQLDLSDDPFLKMILNCQDLPDMEPFRDVKHYNMAVYMYPQVINGWEGRQMKDPTYPMREIRLARVVHYEYMMLLTSIPWENCRYDIPKEFAGDLLDGVDRPGKYHLTKHLMETLRAEMIVLFWRVFEQVYDSIPGADSAQDAHQKPLQVDHALRRHSNTGYFVKANQFKRKVMKSGNSHKEFVQRMCELLPPADFEFPFSFRLNLDESAPQSISRIFSEGVGGSSGRELQERVCKGIRDAANRIPREHFPQAWLQERRPDETPFGLSFHGTREVRVPETPESLERSHMFDSGCWQESGHYHLLNSLVEVADSMPSMLHLEHLSFVTFRGSYQRTRLVGDSDKAGSQEPRRDRRRLASTLSSHIEGKLGALCHKPRFLSMHKGVQVHPTDEDEPAGGGSPNLEEGLNTQFQNLFRKPSPTQCEAPAESIACLEPNPPSPRGKAEDGEVHDVDETRDVDVVADVADGKLTLSYLDLDDVWSIESALDLVKEMDEDVQIQNISERMQESMARLAYGLRTLQHLTLKQQLQAVGLFVVGADVPQHLYSSPSDPKHRKQRPASSTAQKMLLISAPNKALAHRAESLKMAKQVVQQMDGTFIGGFTPKQFMRGGPMQDFYVPSKTEPYNYKPYFSVPNILFDPAQVFTASEKIQLVRHFITSPISEELNSDGTIDARQGGCDLSMREMKAEGVVKDFYPLKQLNGLFKMKYEWARPWMFYGWSGLDGYLLNPLRQDLDEVHGYFGPGVAFYFAYLGFYIKWLLLPSIVGLLIFSCGGTSRKVLTPVFGMCISIWATIFLERWMQRRRRYEYCWANGLQTGESRSRMMRPEFVYELRKLYGQNNEDLLIRWVREALLANDIPVPKSNTQRNMFSNNMLRRDMHSYNEVYVVPRSLRAMRIVLTIFVTTACIVLSIGVTMLCLFIQWITRDTTVSIFGSNINSSYLIAGVANGILIPVMSFVYRGVALYTTDKELHRTDAQHNSSVMLKIFVFQFFNAYNSLFFIAFVERNGAHLKTQIWALLLTGQVLNQVQEALVPCLAHVWKRSFEGKSKKEASLKAIQVFRQGVLLVVRRLSRSWSTGNKPTGSTMPRYSWSIWCASQHTDNSPVAVKSPFPAMHEQVAECIFLPLHAHMFQIDETLEAAIQFGYITLISSFFELAPLLCLVNNILELRIDAHKLVTTTRMPEPTKSLDVLWYRIFRFLIVAGIVSNLLILNYTCWDGPCLSESRNQDRASSLCTVFGNKWCPDDVIGLGTGIDIRTANRTPMYNILDALYGEHKGEDRTQVLVAAEHVLLGIHLFIIMIMSREPPTVVDDQYRQEYFSIRENEFYRKGNVMLKLTKTKPD